MAGEWQDCTLGELIDVKHGFAFPGEFIHDEPRGDILLTPGNFAIGGGFKEDKFKYYDGPVPDDFVLADGDLLVTMTDLSKQSDALGFPAFVPSRSDGRRYLHNQRLGKVQLKDAGKLDMRYLHYLMCTAGYRHEVLASATGTTVKHTSPERILRFRFLRPSLPEQRAIAHILGTLDDKIELNRRMSETLEAIAKALFKSWFVDFDPVRAKLEGRQPEGVDAETAALFPDAFGPDGLPRGWEEKGLDEVASFLNGLALQKFPPDGDDDLPVIKIAQLRKGDTTGADLASNKLDSQYVVNDGDILFSWSGSLEAVVWTGGRGALNQHLFKVTSSTYPKWFFFFWILHHLPDFQDIAANKATTMGHIQRHHLSQARVNVPSSAILEVTNSQMESLLAQIIRNNIESRTLAALRDALLPKLISGALRVKDVERFVKERGL